MSFLAKYQAVWRYAFDYKTPDGVTLLFVLTFAALLVSVIAILIAFVTWSLDWWIIRLLIADLAIAAIPLLFYRKD